MASALQQPVSFSREIWDLLTTDPSKIIDYLLMEVESNPVHVTVEAICLAFIIYMWTMKPHRPKAVPEGEEPTEREKEEMVSGWKSEKMGYISTGMPEAAQEVVTGVENGYLEVENVGKVFDMGSFNYLRLSQDETVLKNALAAVDHYGVGSCGPRGFYGTVQPHLVLEEQLKDIYQTPAAIIYSFQYSTMASIIPAFSGRQDVIVADDGIHMGILGGVELSRSKVFWYKHNDMEDLERVLAKASKQKTVTRRWIVTEGVFRNYGDIAKLDEIVALKEKYKWRVMVDDSYGCGVLGGCGRGVAEHFGFDTLTCDVYVGSMDASLGSIGGFCVGSNMIVDHQRLSSSGYCFSASLPPYAAVAASTAFTCLLDSPSKYLSPLRANSSIISSTLTEHSLVFTSSPGSPIFHITFPPTTTTTRPTQQTSLNQAATELLHKHKISVVVPIYTLDERNPPPPSVRITVSSQLTPEEYKEKAEIIALVVSRYINQCEKGN